VNAVPSSYRLSGLQWLLVGAVWASACQRDADALFDDSGLAAAGRGGSEIAGDAGNGPLGEGGASVGDAGAPPAAGKSPIGGSTAEEPIGGSAAGGEPSSAGKASGGGSGVSGAGGVAGSGPMPPQPVTYETLDLDDAQIASCRPLENFGNEPSFTVDASGSGPGACVYQALLSAPLAKVPEGATIQEATLTLHCTNGGDAVQLGYVDGPWQELGVTWTKRPAQGGALGSVTCAQAGPLAFDLTAAAQAWLTSKQPSYGIYLTTTGDNGTDIASSEASVAAQRPQLRVVYLPEK
jgi:hypothetical protein